MQDNVFMGLNARQTIFGGLGLILGIGSYFLASKNGLGDETASYIAAAIVIPFAALGFVTYNGMSFERLLKVWIKQFFLCPKKIVSHITNICYERDKGKIEQAAEKEAKRRD